MNIAVNDPDDGFSETRWIVYIPRTQFTSNEFPTADDALSFANDLDPKILGQILILRVERTIYRVIR